MAKLKVLLEGAPVEEIELDHEKEYLVGRGTTCDVVLDHPKISRQHLKITFDGKAWNCRVLSRFGNVQVNGHLIENFTFTDSVRVSVPPYELQFAESVAERSGSLSQTNKLGSHSDEKTQPGAVQLNAILLRLKEDDEVEEEIKVGQAKVVAGRSQTCELTLKAPEASRRHFTIEHDGQNFVITDLKSANKTLVNGKEINKQVLESGDEIVVGTDRFRFDIVHPDFENLPAVVPETNPMMAPPPESPAVIKVMPGQMSPYPMQGQYPVAGQGYAPVPRGIAYSSRKLRDPKLKLKLALIVIGVVIAFQILNGGKKEEDVRIPASGATNSTTMNSQDNRTYDRLSPEQKKFVEEEYNLSMNLYTSGKYDMAGIEIEKILKIVNNYKDARNIRDLCQQALEIKKQQDEDARRKQDEKDRLRQITETLDHCQDLLKQKKFGDVEACVDQISNLDPDNERGRNLVLDAKEQQAKIEASAEYRAEMARKKDLAVRTFHAAEKHVKERNFLPAVKEFETVRRLAFVDNERLKEKSEVGIRAAKAALLKESGELVSEGKTAMDQKDYSTALQKFSRALAIYPSNSDAADLRSQASKELHLEMKNLYSESVIEENLGNIESAKKKWRNIIKSDEKGDTYLEKAQIKLRKYEK